MGVKGGNKFDAAIKTLVAKLTNASKVQVGWPINETYPDGTLVGLVALINELGAPSRGQPPRPFMRTTIANHSAEWPELAEQALVSSDYDAEQALGIVGAFIAGQVQQSITDFKVPALAPSTIAKKGSSDVLVQTGQMRRSIVSQVVSDNA